MVTLGLTFGIVGLTFALVALSEVRALKRLLIEKEIIEEDETPKKS